MNNHQRRLLLKIIPYTLISFVSALIFWILELGFLSSGETYPFSENLYSPGDSFRVIVSSIVVLGTGLGLIEESFFKRKFQARSYFARIALKTAIYLSLLLFLLFGQSLALNAIITEKSIFNPAVIDTALNFFFSITLLSIVVYSGFNIALGLLISEIIDYLGLDVVSSFFTGKYSKSVVEERIFMFLDMKDSTSIAEKLGHEMHYEFINTYYGDMTDAIIETKAQIYQYVGDEIVLSWSLKEGLKNSNCLQCFFLIKKAIRTKSQTYQEKFGLIPEFKAGLHLGEVSRGRVGFIKKELLFTGDVLNTTARIQSLCKKLKANLLISKMLRDEINDPTFEYLDKGSFALRGRKKEETLIEVLVP